MERDERIKTQEDFALAVDEMLGDWRGADYHARMNRVRAQYFLRPQPARKPVSRQESTEVKSNAA